MRDESAEIGLSVRRSPRPLRCNYRAAHAQQRLLFHFELVYMNNFKSPHVEKLKLK